MGRKLRFDARKNYERKRKALADANLKLSVSLPLSFYLTSPTTDSDILRNRIERTIVNSTNVLPDGWSFSTSSGVSFTLSSHLFVVSVYSDCSWDIAYNIHKIDCHHSEAFGNVVSTITCVNDVIVLLEVLNSCKLCHGNQDDKFDGLRRHYNGVFKDKSGSTVAFYDERPLPIPSIRHTKCSIVMSSGSAERCKDCEHYRSFLFALRSRYNRRIESPQTTSISSHANYRYMTTPGMINRLKALKRDNRVLSKRVDRLRLKLAAAVEQEGIEVDSDTASDLREIISEENQVVESLPEDSFRKIFWEQQQLAASKKKTAMRWHPLMIKWCLYLRHLSGKAYETLRQSGCIYLPSQRTLRDYSNCVKAGPGFFSEVDRQLLAAARLSSSPEWHRLVCVVLDEMHIREDLVYNKHSGQLIGFVDLGNVNNQLLAFERFTEDGNSTSCLPVLAKSMLTFMVKGLFTSLKYPYGHFPCSTLTGDLLFNPFWEAISRLERMGFKVLGCTFDGASVNRKLVKIHDASDPLLYKVRNIYAEDNRFIYFFSDPPHLIKTTRNCWASSRRNLQINGKYISWRHLRELYERDRGRGTGLAMVPKLKFEHLNLSSFSKMRVDLAAQVLSESVSKALMMTGGPEVEETARFVMIFDKFFDLLNVRNFKQGDKQRKPFMQPYYNGADSRLHWLETVFLPYLDTWERSVNSMTGVESGEKEKMLLSKETLLGLRRTAKSFIEFVKFVYSLPEVYENQLAFLSFTLSQDSLENFFGCQRQRGGTSDNPSVKEFCENTQALRVVDSFCRPQVRGNCRGVNSSKPVTEDDCTPLPKRRHNRTKTV